MTVSHGKKRERRRIVVEHVTRVFERTGLNAFQQAMTRKAAPIHDLINERARQRR